MTSLRIGLLLTSWEKIEKKTWNDAYDHVLTRCESSKTLSSSIETWASMMELNSGRNSNGLLNKAKLLI